MARPDQDIDRKWDATLRRVGPHLGLTEPPHGAAQRWKRPAGDGHRPRRLTLWTGTGALAAAIVIMVVMMFGPRQLDAETVFDDLRQALQRSMSLSFEDVEIELARLRPDLHGYLRCSGSVQTAAAGDRQAYADLALSLGAESAAGRVPPLDFQLVTAADPGAEWAYIRLENPPRAPAGLDPRVAFLADLASRGCYVDLASLLKSKAGRRVAALPAFGLGAVLRLRDRQGLETLIDLIEEQAEEIELTPLGEDRWELRASGFRIGKAQAGGDDRVREVLGGLLRDMELHVQYETRGGVRRLEMDRFGHGRGRVTLELSEVQFDDTLLDRARHQQTHPGPTLNLRMLRALRKLGSWLSSS